MTKGYKDTILTLMFAALAILSSKAEAAERTRCEILTVQASNSGRGIAESLTQYAEIFKKPPFATYDSFELLDRQVVELALAVPTQLTLPENIGGSLNLNGRIGKQLDLTLTLSRNKKTPITIRGHASPGAPLIAAGMTSSKGIWVFGVVCTEPRGTVSF